MSPALPPVIVLALMLASACGGGGGILAQSPPQPAVPRIQLNFRELQASGTLQNFSLLSRNNDFRILLLDEDQDRFFVGAKDHVVSLDMNNIEREPLTAYWPAGRDSKEECKLAGKDAEGECGNFVRVIQPYNRTHLYVCGTGAYHPICTYANVGRRAEVLLPPGDRTLLLSHGKPESGKGKCSYSPKLESVSLMINEELCSGVYLDFMGTDATLFRTLGKPHSLRTDQYNSRWLNEPVFLDMHMIPDSGDRNDDKLYFFFREKATESGNQKSVYARIGRVCINDMGGQRSLVNKWSTFLKARLVCSVTGADGIETHFDELQDIFVLKTEEVRNPLIYGVFSTTGSVFRGSAVCVYNMADIRMVFNGPFAHKEGPNYQWVPYQGKIPYPRPGTCPGGTFTPFMKSTKEFPDDVVSFIQTHPTMFNPVQSIHKQPIIVRTNIPYKFTRIAVDQVDAADGRYDIVFLGTDHGTVQKLIVLPKDDAESKEEIVLEELQVFQDPVPILSMKISSKRQQLYVSSAVGVTQLPLHRCGVYGKACADCCLARDPYCAWDGKQCSKYFPTAKRRSRRQDIRHGNPVTQCRGFNGNLYKRLPEVVQFAVEGSSTFMECGARSPQAVVKWLVQRLDSDRRKEVKPSERLARTEHGLLIRAVQRSDAGMYHCLATENGFRHTLGRYTVRVLDSGLVGGLLTGAAVGTDPSGTPLSQQSPAQKQAYKELMELLGQSRSSPTGYQCPGTHQPAPQAKQQQPAAAAAPPAPLAQRQPQAQPQAQPQSHKPKAAPNPTATKHKPASKEELKLRNRRNPHAVAAG
ncbi:semaphorin-3F isoform X1 [Petromyzon marinus]|uniref:semaphorin-3F isoform X1 n=1 Tax=Petromyzon marinus TaxID=7757 RepID=UPI003F7207D7